MFAANAVGTMEYPYAGKRNNENLTPYTKIKSKFIINLYIKHNSTKLSEENMGGNLYHLELDEFLKRIQKVKSI